LFLRAILCSHRADWQKGSLCKETRLQSTSYGTYLKRYMVTLFHRVRFCEAADARFYIVTRSQRSDDKRALRLPLSGDWRCIQGNKNSRPRARWHTRSKARRAKVPARVSNHAWNRFERSRARSLSDAATVKVIDAKGESKSKQRLTRDTGSGVGASCHLGLGAQPDSTLGVAATRLDLRLPPSNRFLDRLLAWDSEVQRFTWLNAHTSHLQRYYRSILSLLVAFLPSLIIIYLIPEISDRLFTIPRLFCSSLAPSPSVCLPSRSPPLSLSLCLFSYLSGLYFSVFSSLSSWNGGGSN